MHSRTLNLAGAFLGDELNFERNLTIEIDDNNIISDIYPRKNGENKNYVALPPLVNSHVHTGDYAFPEAGNSLKIEELVAPPNGLKHVLLRKTRLNKIKQARVQSLKLNWMTGVFAVADFVEGGSFHAKEAHVRSMIRHVILGRPDNNDFDNGLSQLARWVNGLGIPDAFSYSHEQMEELSQAFKGRPIFIHVSETAAAHIKGDYSIAMVHLKPTALVHGTHLTKEEIRDAVAKRVSIVLCPRSNLWFGSGMPPLKYMLDEGVNLALGTDNVGWIKPDIWREMEAAVLLLRHQDPTFNKPVEVLKMATLNPARMLGLGDISIKKGNSAKFILLNANLMAIERALDPAWAVIKRGGPEAIVKSSLKMIAGNSGTLTRS
ncbi:MAG: amidohydrolase family protein [Nitrososphaeria archaeon]